MVLHGWSPGQQCYINCERIRDANRWIRSDPLGVGPRNLCLNKPSRWLWCKLKLKNLAGHRKPRLAREGTPISWFISGCERNQEAKIKEMTAVGSRSENKAVDFLMIFKQKGLKYIMKYHLCSKACWHPRFCWAVYLHTHLIKTLLSQIEGLCCHTSGQHKRFTRLFKIYLNTYYMSNLIGNSTGNLTICQ